MVEKFKLGYESIPVLYTYSAARARFLTDKTNWAKILLRVTARSGFYILKMGIVWSLGHILPNANDIGKSCPTFKGLFRTVHSDISGLWCGMRIKQGGPSIGKPA